MSMRRIAPVVLALAATLPAVSLAQGGGAVLIRAERLIDGLGNVIEPGRILIEGERIVSVGPELTAPAGTRTIDLGDATILPGLIDFAHAPHLRGRGALGGGADHHDSW